MKRVTKIFFSSFISTTVLLPTNCFFSSCSKSKSDYVICNINGSDWTGSIPGSVFLPSDYQIDEEQEIVTYINSTTFSSKGTLIIPDYVSYNEKKYKVKLGDKCFLDNSWIEGTVVLNSFIDSIPTECFAFPTNFSSITKVIFKTHPIKFGNYAFLNCKSLDEVSVAINGFESKQCFKSTVHVGNSAFKNCSRLSNNIIFGKQLSYIGQEAFSGCDQISLASFSFATQITRLPDMLFAKCLNLREVDMGASIDTIGVKTFNECDRLEIINLPIENMKFELSTGCFESCPKLTGFSKKCFFKNLPEDCFHNCPSLQIEPWLDKVDGEFVKIGKSAFQTCSYRKIKFLKGMPQPEELAFANQTGHKETEIMIIDLTDFQAESEVLDWTTEPTSGNNMFAGKPDMGRIYFSKNSTTFNEKWKDVFRIMGFKDSDFTKDKWWIEYI